MLPPDTQSDPIAGVLTKMEEPKTSEIDLEELAKAVMELLKQELRINNERIGKRNYPK